jgi:hypothetical protein
MYSSQPLTIGMALADTMMGEKTVRIARIADNPPAALGQSFLGSVARRTKMNSVRIAAVVLIVGGVLGLAYGGFSYTKETHEANLGPIELSIKDKQTVNIPVWAGVGAIVIGGALLLLGGKRS